MYVEPQRYAFVTMVMCYFCTLCICMSSVAVFFFFFSLGDREMMEEEKKMHGACLSHHISVSALMPISHRTSFLKGHKYAQL